jgi:iron-sulfur cluster assembly accessory protein
MGFIIGIKIFMIEISPNAAKEIRRLIIKQQVLNNRFHLSVRPGGCNDFVYNLSFNVEQTEPFNKNHIFNCNGIEVIISSESLNFINGLKLDYSEDLMGGTFRFYNPQAGATCSCGYSFSLKIIY